MTDKNNSFTLKILTLGNSAVGKSSLLLRYCRNKFSSSYQSTIGVDFYVQKTEIEGFPVKLSLWDTAGQEKFKVIVSKYYKGADGFLVIYSVDNRQSFDQISYWISCIQNDCDNKQVQMVLIGNKSDSNERVVSEAEGIELAKQYNIPFFETSALQNVNCVEAMNALSLLCFKKAQEKRKLSGDNNNNNNTIVLLSPEQKDDNIKKKKRNCC